LERTVSQLESQIAKLKLHKIEGIMPASLNIAHPSTSKENVVLNDSVDSDADMADNDRDLLNSSWQSDSSFSFLDNGVLPSFTAEEIRSFGVKELRKLLTSLQAKREDIKKDISLAVLDDYKEKLAKYEKEAAELTAITKVRDEHRNFCERLKKLRMTEFMEGFTRIGLALKDTYQTITLGGDAGLDLVDSLDPFSEGVSFSVRPPKKSWKQITNLSGGEKTLASLSLVFALHTFRPTPLYVMDEIDAALDFRNVTIISHYVKERTKNAQFIIISLRNNMFEKCDRLIGIYKVEDCTQNVCVDPHALNAQFRKDMRRERLAAALRPAR
jgi:structural maintenance of chromosome 4